MESRYDERRPLRGFPQGGCAGMQVCRCAFGGVFKMSQQGDVVVTAAFEVRNGGVSRLALLAAGWAVDACIGLRLG